MDLEEIVIRQLEFADTDVFIYIFQYFVSLHVAYFVVKMNER